MICILNSHKDMRYFWNACADGNLSKVKKFSDQVDISAKHNRALRVAAAHGRNKVFRYLCGLGANPTYPNNRCIGLAAESGDLDLVKYCVSLGCDPTTDDNYAIRFACGRGHADVTKYLYETCNCDIHARDDNGLKIALFWYSFSFSSDSRRGSKRGNYHKLFTYLFSLPSFQSLPKDLTSYELNCYLEIKKRIEDPEYRKTVLLEVR